MTLSVKIVGKEDVDFVWPLIAPYVQAALKESDVAEYDADDVYEYLKSGNMAAAVGLNESNAIVGALTFSLLQYPKDNIVFITSIGGKFVSDAHTVDQFSAIVKKMGATKIQGYVQQSGARLWKKLHFREKALLVEIDL